jgi:hypothetical protein
LTVFSLCGLAGAPFVKSGFIALHAERARQYGFPIRPEDLQAALREVAGTFIKPWSEHGVEFVDPSVLDLLNTVVRGAPENAVDIVAGAANFDQIERIWKFSKAEKSKPVATALAQNVNRLESSIGRCMLGERRINLGGFSVGYRGATFERRLAILTDMADLMPSGRFSELVVTLFNRLQQEWKRERVVINDAVDALRVMHRAHPDPTEEVLKRTEILRSALLTEIKDGCRSDELREVIFVLGTSGQEDDVVLNTARVAFEKYLQNHFSDEIRECQSRDQFDGLIGDLIFFKDELGVNVAVLIERVEQAKAEFENEEDAYDDHIQDELKDLWRAERASERTVSEMFDSLRDDRG